MSINVSVNAMSSGLRKITAVLAVVVGMHGITPSAFASPIPSEPVSMEHARAADLATIQQMLEMKVVQHRLEELGFTPDEVVSRLNMASHAELHDLATQSEDVLAGGDGGIVVTVLVVILLVLLILRLTSNENGEARDTMVA